MEPQPVCLGETSPRSTKQTQFLFRLDSGSLPDSTHTLNVGTSDVKEHHPLFNGEGDRRVYPPYFLRPQTPNFFEGVRSSLHRKLFVHDVAAAFDNIPEAPAKRQCLLMNKNRMTNLHRSYSWLPGGMRRYLETSYRENGWFGGQARSFYREHRASDEKCASLMVC